MVVIHGPLLIKHDYKGLTGTNHRSNDHDNNGHEDALGIQDAEIRGTVQVSSSNDRGDNRNHGDPSGGDIGAEESRNSQAGHNRQRDDTGSDSRFQPDTNTKGRGRCPRGGSTAAAAPVGDEPARHPNGPHGSGPDDE
jgi:hypothetical protein